MMTLAEFCYNVDPSKNDAIKTMKKLGKIKDNIENYSQLN